MFKKGDVVRLNAANVNYPHLAYGKQYVVTKTEDIGIGQDKVHVYLEGVVYFVYAKRFELVKEGAIIGAPLTLNNAKIGMKVVLVNKGEGVYMRGVKNGDVFTVAHIGEAQVRLEEIQGNYFLHRFTIAPEPVVIGPGTKMRCIEGHRESGLRKDKIVTIKKVGKTIYYLEEFPGLGFAKRRFEAAAAPVAAPIAPVAPPAPEIKEGDTVYIVKRMPSHDHWKDSLDEAMAYGVASKVAHKYGDMWYLDLNGGTYVPKACLAHQLPPGFVPKPPFEGDLREALLEKMNKLGKGIGNVTSFAYIAHGKNPQFLINPACYAPLRYATRIEQLVVSTAGHRKNLNAEKLATCRVYFDYLLNRSPWSPCFITKDVEEALEKGVVMNCDRPIGEVVGAAITIREATEFQGRLPMFQWAIDNGLSGDVAYIYGYFVNKVGADRFSMGDGAVGHSAFYAHHTLHDVVSFFKNGFPDKGNPPARAGSQAYAIDESIRTGKGGGISLHAYMHQVEKVMVGEGFHKNLVITAESLIKLGKALEQLFTKEVK